jgi:hypothetical protein
MNKKLIIVIFLSIFTIIGLAQCFNYWYRVHRQEDEYISTFFKSRINGSLTYIQLYERNPDTYVISNTDSTGIEKTIGKIQISNFNKAQIGDKILKSPNSFDLIVTSDKKNIVSTIRF